MASCHHLAFNVLSALAKILLCRTATLKGRSYECPQCDYQTNLYNSCTDRNCPQCSGARRRNWLEKSSQLILPGINYFQVIFTLPDKLSPLILGNRQQLYSLLFRSAWRALNHCLRQSGQYQPAALMVLHTWNQHLEHHPHIHALVPGGGPALEGDRWITAKHPTNPDYRKPYLVDNVELGRAFRKRFVMGLRRLVRNGQLKLEQEWSKLNDPHELKRWCAELKQTDWNVFIEGPPGGRSRPEHVLRYLTRYLAGGPIHDSRIISDQDGMITFWARSRKNRNQLYQAELSGRAFLRRWILHILPKGFTRSRRYGGFHSTQSKTYLERCQQLLPRRPDDAQDRSTPQIDAQATSQSTQPQCPNCKVELTCTFKVRRPSWKQVFEVDVYRQSVYCPLLHSCEDRPP